jgi:succinate-semialdehyde dehydrogenase/glutarate-semialdehyde dehydrogenase
MSLISINPYNNQLIATYKQDANKTIHQKIDATALAQKKWKALSITKRATYFIALQKQLQKNRNSLAELITTEMGKPITQSYLEVDKCAMVCEYYATRTTEFLQPEIIASNATKSYTHFEPIGNILAVMPWNFPFWQVFRSMAPIMMGGNGYVLKHASNVYGCAKAIEQLILSAKFPKDIFQLLCITSADVHKAIANENIHAITCTGSTAAGQAVAMYAAKHLKKCVLELGGSDAYVVLADADLQKAVTAALYSRMINNGQSCIAAKRFIVVKKVYQQFLNLLHHEMCKLVIGNPMEEKTTIGPLAKTELKDELLKQVKASIKKGAISAIPQLAPNQGAFFSPMILHQVQKGMTAYNEELFGPVCTVIVAQNEKDALQIANDTTFGLGAAVFTSNIAKGEDIARHQLDAGNCFVNDFVRSVPGLAFGGVKQSGYGRELGKWGMYEFMNIKTVYVA